MGDHEKKLRRTECTRQDKLTKNGRLASVMGNHLTTSHKLPQDDNVEIDYESEHDPDLVQTVLIHDTVDSETDKIVSNLRLGLKREQQIILRDLTGETGEISDATEKLIEYLTFLNGVLVICVPSIHNILSGKSKEEELVEISISGKRTKINAHKIHGKIKESADLAKKILILKVPGVANEMPEGFAETQVIDLPKDFDDCKDSAIQTIFDYWTKHCILGRLIALKKRNMFISADSVEH